MTCLSSLCYNEYSKDPKQVKQKGSIFMTTLIKRKEKKEELSNLKDISLTAGIELLRDSAEEIQSYCQDHSIQDVSTHNLIVNGKTNGVQMLFDSDKGAGYRYSTSPHALSQLCNKLGVPVRYIEKCIARGYTDLAETNLNEWIDDYGKDLFLRCYKDRVRGVLSNRYSVLDAPEIIDILGKTTRGLNMKVKSYFMNEERFHARIVQQDLMKVKGEDLHAGIQVDSSDVGRSTLKVNFFIFKQICTNGLAVTKGQGQLFNQRHITISSDDFQEQLSNALWLLPELVADYEHIIQRCSLQHSLFKQDSKTTLDKAIEDFIQKLRFMTKLDESGAKKVLDLMKLRYDTSDWGIVNSITEVAQDYTLERRIELETIAGNMLKVV